MLDASLFVSDTIHEREITLADGKKQRLHFKEVSSTDFEGIRSGTGGALEQHARVSRAIAASLCLPDGKPAINVAQAGKLKDGVRLALVVAIAEVNGIGASVGKVSPLDETNGSGTSSSSPESAGEQLSKPNDESGGASS